MKKTKMIFFIQGYDAKMEDGRITEVINFELYANSYDEAVERAKKLYPKNLYRLSGVIEK